jgi:hypothetical protein
MKRWLARYLRRLADWLDPPVLPPPLVDPALVSRAALIVAEVDQLRHTSAYKRAIAFKTMRGEFPDVPRRDIAMAIELAVRQVTT